MKTEDDHEDTPNDNDEVQDYENDEYDDNEGDYGEDEEEEEDCSNEVDERAVKKKRGWSFWSNPNTVESSQDQKDQKESRENGRENGRENKDEKPADKEKDKKRDVSNTLLTTAALPTRQDLLANDQKQQDGEVDDAVLYKPHDLPLQFNKINTHKNENLRENLIVPNWNLCLPLQTSSLSSTTGIAQSLFGSASTANQNQQQNQKLDLRSWRQVLNQLLNRLGFSSQSLVGVVGSADREEGVEGDDTAEGDSHAEMSESDQVEREVNLLYEKTYRLYGRSLAKLPNRKRACLPNYNKYYTVEGHTQDLAQHNYLYNPEQGVTISNDPMGNLLINHKPNSGQRSGTFQSNIVTQKAGPLRKIKKILIIGVHGFFPTRMIRPIIGAPKGTSLKFANEAEKAMIRYCVENNMISDDETNSISIQKIALEKEGKIFDRVQFFTDILTQWQREINDADFIFVASHSQGCVVSIILLARLIKLGILKDAIKKRIGLLGMAGINNGPFYGVDKSFFMKAYSAIEHDSLMELFELTKFASEQSLVYKESMQIIINANVKLTFIGSINDQLVPMYSAVASHVFHPNIYRACYIDHASLTPPFISKLVSLCCHLLNIGFFDNNVLKELSPILAGPLTGGGHSKIYNDGKVYDLGIKFALDTDDIVIPPTSSSHMIAELANSNHEGLSEGSLVKGVGGYDSLDAAASADEVHKLPFTNQVYIKEYNVSKVGTNPFILPWCLRGLLFNIEKNWPNNNKLLLVDNGRDVGKNGYDEINELYELFELWKPETKILKDLKFRLNGLRASKL